MTEMEKLVEVTLEIDAELKEQAEQVCLEKGLTYQHWVCQNDLCSRQRIEYI